MPFNKETKPEKKKNENEQRIMMKGCSAFSKAPSSLESYNQIPQCHIQDTRWGRESYPSAEVQSVYFTATDDWARKCREKNRI